MPRDVDVRVMNILSALEISPEAAKAIEAMGNDAVTLVCEVALRSISGLRPKVYANAVFLAGRMTHPQAVETIRLLVNDPDPDIAIRAMRAAARQKDVKVVSDLGRYLTRTGVSPLLATEAANALAAIDSAEARRYLDAYQASRARSRPRSKH